MLDTDDSERKKASSEDAKARLESERAVDFDFGNAYEVVVCSQFEGTILSAVSIHSTETIR